eukprot:scaffold97649_cov29-Tisochrysis_lutea.AAC.1
MTETPWFEPWFEPATMRFMSTRMAVESPTCAIAHISPSSARQPAETVEADEWTESAASSCAGALSQTRRTVAVVPSETPAHPNSLSILQNSRSTSSLAKEELESPRRRGASLSTHACAALTPPWPSKTAKQEACWSWSIVVRSSAFCVGL